MESLIGSKILFENVSPNHLENFKNGSVRMDFKSDFEGLESTFSSTKERHGFLRMYGSGSIEATKELSMYAYPINANHATVSTSLEFSPATSEQSAGLLLFQNIENWFYLKITNSDELGKIIQISKRDNQILASKTISPIKVTSEENISLKITLENDKLLFYYSTVKYQWHKIGKTFKATFLEEAKKENDLFFGMLVEDRTSNRLYADFKFFKYTEH